MRIPYWLVFVLAVVLGGPAVNELREATRISQICWSAWIGIGLGLIFFGVFISWTLRDKPAHQ